MKCLILSLGVALAACGGAPSTPPQHHAPAANSDAAVASLRDSKFTDARAAATSALGRDARDARAAAVRAIANYEISSHDLFDELRGIVERSDHLQFFDHKGGREAWQRWLNMLEGAQKDLEIAAADESFSLELCLACWQVDWNHNGRLDEGDTHMLEIEDDGHGGSLPAGDPRRRPTFRFDRGDAEWALAMLSFQRAVGELVLAYKWSALDEMFAHDKSTFVIPLAERDRVTKARNLILDGLAHAEKCRALYLAETDDDREWVPNPTQKNHPVPLEMDAAVYATWDAVIGDLRRMLEGQEALSLRDVAHIIDNNPEMLAEFPDAYIDIGRMLKEPKEIRIDMTLLMKHVGTPEAEQFLRGLIGNGYQTSMKASPLPGRLRAMKQQLDRGEDTFDRKLRYLLWLN